MSELKSFSKPLKAISCALVLSFLGEQLLWAGPEIKPFTFPKDNTVRLSFQFPESVAVVEDSFKSPSTEKTIYLFQDAHTNESGQRNLAKALDILLTHNKDIKYVFTEAGVEDNSLTFLREKAPLNIRKAASDVFLKKGLLHGAELLQLTSQHEFVLWGVEDMTLYQKALSNYRAVAKIRPKLKDYLSKVRTTLKTLSPKVLNPVLDRYLSDHMKYQRGEMALTDHFESLTRLAETQNINLSQYPDLSLLRELKQRESQIDFEKANVEQATAIKNLNEADQEELTEAAKNEPGRLGVNGKEKKAFYKLLEEKIKRTPGHQSTGYPELEKYFDYLDLSKKLDAKNVLDELDQLQAELFVQLAVSETERTFIRSARLLGLYEKLFDLTLTAEEYRSYKDLSRDFGIQELAGSLNDQIMHLGSFYERALFLEEGYGDAVQRSEEFYELTLARDERFVEKMLAKMTSTGHNDSVLVAGGYHATNLKYLLKQKGISFVSVMPQILQETNLKRYESILLGQNVPTMAAPNAGRLLMPLALSLTPHIKAYEAHLKGQPAVLQGARLASSQQKHDEYAGMRAAYDMRKKVAEAERNLYTLPTADIIVITAWDKKMVSLYERYVSEQIGAGNIRNDIPIVVLPNDGTNLGNGGMLANSIDYVTQNFDRWKVDPKYRGNLGRIKDITKANIIILQAGGPGQRFTAARGEGIFTKPATMLPVQENTSGAKAPMTSVMTFALEGGYVLSRELRKSNRSGLIIIAADTGLVFDATKPGLLEDGFNLITSPESAESIAGRLGVVVTDKTGKVETFLEKPSRGEMNAYQVIRSLIDMQGEQARALPANTANAVIAISDESDAKAFYKALNKISEMMRQRRGQSLPIFEIDTSTDLIIPKTVSLDEYLDRRLAQTNPDKKDYYTRIYHLVRDNFPTPYAKNNDHDSTLYVDFGNVKIWHEILTTKNPLRAILNFSMRILRPDIDRIASTAAVDPSAGIYHSSIMDFARVLRKAVVFNSYIDADSVIEEGSVVIGIDGKVTNQPHTLLLESPILQTNQKTSAIIYTRLTDIMTRPVMTQEIWDFMKQWKTPDGRPFLEALGIRVNEQTLLASLPIWPVTGRDRAFDMSYIQWMFDPSGPSAYTASARYMEAVKLSYDQIGQMVDYGMTDPPAQGARLSSWVEENVPGLKDKHILEVTMEMALSGKLLELLKAKLDADPSLTEEQRLQEIRKAAMSTSVGGIGPLLKERVIAQSELGADVTGVSLLYDQVWVQHINQNGDLELKKEALSSHIKEVLEYVFDLPIKMYDGRTVTAKVWKAPAGTYGKGSVYFLDPQIASEITYSKVNVVYPGQRDIEDDASARFDHSWILGRGALAIAKKIGKAPDIAVMSEASAMMVHHKVFKDDFTEDPFFEATNYIFNDHTPLPYAHPLWDSHTLKKLNVDRRYYDEETMPVWDKASGKLDATALMINASEGVFGVAKKHARVMRGMELLRQFADKITSVTNGVSPSYWPKDEFSDPEKVMAMTDEELIAVKRTRRLALIAFLAKRLSERKDGYDWNQWAEKVAREGNPIGVWVRRIVEYKRLGRFADILENDRMRQEFINSGIIFIAGGRIHQDDNYGLTQFYRIHKAIKNDTTGLLRERVIFFDNYNIWEAPELFSGADFSVMLADDGREASATGFQKGQMNGDIIIASDDGAVPESVRFYNGSNSAVANGLLVPYYNGEPTANGLLAAFTQFSRIFRDEPLLARMIRNAVNQSRRVSVDRTARKMLEYLEQIQRSADAGDKAAEQGAARADKVIATLGLKPDQARHVLAHINQKTETFIWRYKINGFEEKTLTESAPGLRGFVKSFEYILSLGTIGLWSLSYHIVGQNGRSDIANHIEILFKDTPVLQSVSAELFNINEDHERYGYLKQIETRLEEIASGARLADTDDDKIMDEPLVDKKAVVMKPRPKSDAVYGESVRDAIVQLGLSLEETWKYFNNGRVFETRVEQEQFFNEHVRETIAVFMENHADLLNWLQENRAFGEAAGLQYPDPKAYHNQNEVYASDNLRMDIQIWNPVRAAQTLPQKKVFAVTVPLGYGFSERIYSKADSLNGALRSIPGFEPTPSYIEDAGTLRQRVNLNARPVPVLVIYFGGKQEEARWTESATLKREQVVDWQHGSRQELLAVHYTQGMEVGVWHEGMNMMGAGFVDTDADKIYYGKIDRLEYDKKDRTKLKAIHVQLYRNDKQTPFKTVIITSQSEQNIGRWVWTGRLSSGARLAEFEVGTRVLYPKYGVGVVEKVIPGRAGESYQVRFNNGQIRLVGVSVMREYSVSALVFDTADRLGYKGWIASSVAAKLLHKDPVPFTALMRRESEKNPKNVVSVAEGGRTYILMRATYVLDLLEKRKAELAAASQHGTPLEALLAARVDKKYVKALYKAIGRKDADIKPYLVDDPKNNAPRFKKTDGAFDPKLLEALRMKYKEAEKTLTLTEVSDRIGHDRSMLSRAVWAYVSDLIEAETLPRAAKILKVSESALTNASSMYADKLPLVRRVKPDVVHQRGTLILFGIKESRVAALKKEFDHALNAPNGQRSSSRTGARLAAAERPEKLRSFIQVTDQESLEKVYRAIDDGGRSAVQRIPDQEVAYRGAPDNLSHSIGLWSGPENFSGEFRSAATAKVSEAIREAGLQDVYEAIDEQRLVPHVAFYFLERDEEKLLSRLDPDLDREIRTVIRRVVSDTSVSAPLDIDFQNAPLLTQNFDIILPGIPTPSGFELRQRFETALQDIGIAPTPQGLFHMTLARIKPGVVIGALPIEERIALKEKFNTLQRSLDGMKGVFGSSRLSRLTYGFNISPRRYELDPDRVSESFTIHTPEDPLSSAGARLAENERWKKEEGRGKRVSAALVLSLFVGVSNAHALEIKTPQQLPLTLGVFTLHAQGRGTVTVSEGGYTVDLNTSGREKKIAALLDRIIAHTSSQNVFVKIQASLLQSDESLVRFVVEALAEAQRTKDSILKFGFIGSAAELGTLKLRLSKLDEVMGGKLFGNEGIFDLSGRDPENYRVVNLMAPGSFDQKEDQRYAFLDNTEGQRLSFNIRLARATGQLDIADDTALDTEYVRAIELATGNRKIDRAQLKGLIQGQILDPAIQKLYAWLPAARAINISESVSALSSRLAAILQAA